MRRAMLFGLSVGLGMLVLSVAPDIRRYIKITMM